MKSTLTITFAVIMSNLAIGQIDLENRIKNKVNQRVEQKVDQAIDKTLDNTEEEAKEAAKGGKNKKDKSKKDESSSEENANSTSEKNETNTSSSSSKASLKTYGKFDFVPGDKVILVDQFENVAIGDFPVEWNTNSSAEIVNIDGHEGKYLLISKEGIFMPDYFTDFPENFTLQFDLASNEDFSYYSSGLETTFLSTNNRAKLNDFTTFSHPAFAARFSLHPMGVSSNNGAVYFANFDSEGNELIKSEVTSEQFFATKSNYVKVSIWRQKQRLRIYLNEEKVLDIPRAFDANAKYNALTFNFGGKSQELDRYIIGNLRFAVGAPDTRSKLITEGKLVTRGILFDSGSEKIKPESFGTLKDIATVLTENPDVKVQIVGHTDSDGDEAKNLELSKKRAQAVKEALTNEFKIDSSRMETNGQGESQPSDKNDTPAGKANNRRVEFIKL